MVQPAPSGYNEPVRRHRKAILIVLATVVAVFVAIQFVPYRVTNPPVTQEPPWDSARTRQLAVAACFDCHSNQTHTLWWEDVAPVSWWITNHVEEGRAALNFSEWDKSHHGADDAAETVSEGSMPPNYYTWLGMHGDAELTAAQRRELAAGFKKTFGGG
jgi:hypothetical protein